MPFPLLFLYKCLWCFNILHIHKIIFLVNYCLFKIIILLFKDDDQRSSLGWMLQSSKIRGPQISISVTIKINVMVTVFNVCKQNCIKKPSLGTCSWNYEHTPINYHAKWFKYLIISAFLHICFQRNIFNGMFLGKYCKFYLCLIDN